MANAIKCTRCPLHKKASSNCLGGNGADRPVWLFVGEAPGVHEDEEGAVFVGRAGFYLRETLHDKLGFPDPQCRFTNAVRCWPGPGNPTPSAKSIAECRSWLDEEITQVRPRVVVLLGGVAIRSILGKETSVARVRGTSWERDGVLYTATYHPAYLLRISSEFDDSPILKEWLADLTRAKELAVSGIPSPTEKPQWLVASTFDESMDILQMVEDFEGPVAHDIETQGEPWESDRMWLTEAYCMTPGTAYCVPLMHPQTPWIDRAGQLIARIGEVRASRTRRGLRWEAYSCPMEIKFPASFGLPPVEYEFDPYLAHHLLDEKLASPSQKQLAHWYTNLGGYERELDDYIVEHPECRPGRGPGFGYGNIPLQLLGEYNAADADICKRLRVALEPKIKSEGLDLVLQEIALPASSVMAEYEVNGLYIDPALLSKLMSSYPRRMGELSDRIRSLEDVASYELAMNIVLKQQAVEGYRAAREAYREKLRAGVRARPPKPPKIEPFIFNAGSADQVKAVLFDVAGLQVTHRTPKGQPSLNKAAKEVLSAAHPLVPLKSEYDSLSKFFGTYIKTMSVVDDAGLYHGYYNLAGTRTGRLSSNIQQIPRTGTNADIRRMLSSRFGDRGQMLEADYSQGELRCMCVESRDPALTKIYRAGLDAHTIAAAWQSGELDVGEIADAPKVDPEWRVRIKAGISFGLIYGRSAEGLAKDFGWEVDQAQEFIDQYFSIFKGVRKKILQFQREALKKGYVTNKLGRRRRLPEAQSTEPAVRSHALRQAVNSPIQSLLHDLMLFASVHMLRMFKELRLESRMCGEAHDNVFVDVLNDEREEVLAVVRGCMEGVEHYFDWIHIPFVVDIKMGPTLADTEEVPAFVTTGKGH